MTSRDSKLDPHHDRVLIWRETGLTYEQIRSLLHENHNVSISTRVLKAYVSKAIPPAVRVARASLDPYRTQVTSWLETNGLSVGKVLEKLRQQDPALRDLSKRTLERALQDWSVHKLQLIDSPIVRLRIISLYFNELCSDEEISEDLRAQGFDITKRSVQSVRLAMKLRRRSSDEDWLSEENQFRAFISEELSRGQLSQLGRGLLYTQIRSEGYNISRQACIRTSSDNKLTFIRNRLFSLVKELNPQGVEERRRCVRQRHGRWKSPGPNYMWSIDAHLKLQFYGIEVYAAIDTFSRYVIWSYVGNSGTTAVSVVRQYLDTVEDIGMHPRLLMSDHGGETTLIADAHFTLIRSLEGLENLPFAESYRFATSRENQRIESWWNQQTKGCLKQWQVRTAFVCYHFESSR
jgi:hypothetical protein